MSARVVSSHIHNKGQAPTGAIIRIVAVFLFQLKQRLGHPEDSLF